jgi:hypothetical protein
VTELGAIFNGIFAVVPFNEVFPQTLPWAALQCKDTSTAGRHNFNTTLCNATLTLWILG